jgi:hypothetical protein
MGDLNFIITPKFSSYLVENIILKIIGLFVISFYKFPNAFKGIYIKSQGKNTKYFYFSENLSSSYKYNIITSEKLNDFISFLPKYFKLGFFLFIFLGITLSLFSLFLSF